MGSKLHVCGAEITQSFQSSLWADFLIRNYLRLPLKILNQAWHFIRDALIYIWSVFTRCRCFWYDLWVVIMISRSRADNWHADSLAINLDIVACATEWRKTFCEWRSIVQHWVLSANSWRKLLISAPSHHQLGIPFIGISGTNLCIAFLHKPTLRAIVVRWKFLVN